MYAHAQVGFNRVRCWLAKNMLTLNVTQTKYMVFALKHNALLAYQLARSLHTPMVKRPLIETVAALFSKSLLGRRPGWPSASAGRDPGELRERWKHLSCPEF
ncbi:hypothetical protein EVAR_13459_1 [Eumeta japonica]|uniref:Uncharacterized protein n=1 Tax=Eumeta variegata TaxID=151549 RepID=A0A4C1UYM4_EUMVA|nr:hypothetical protein EVAR_13459_1 [Eumeta japonica]